MSKYSGSISLLDGSSRCFSAIAREELRKHGYLHSSFPMKRCELPSNEGKLPLLKIPFCTVASVRQPFLKQQDIGDGKLLEKLAIK